MPENQSLDMAFWRSPLQPLISVINVSPSQGHGHVRRIAGGDNNDLQFEKNMLVNLWRKLRDKKLWDLKMLTHQVSSLNTSKQVLLLVNHPPNNAKMALPSLNFLDDLNHNTNRPFWLRDRESSDITHYLYTYLLSSFHEKAKGSHQYWQVVSFKHICSLYVCLIKIRGVRQKQTTNPPGPQVTL